MLHLPSFNETADRQRSVKQASIIPSVQPWGPVLSVCIILSGPSTFSECDFGDLITTAISASDSIVWSFGPSPKAIIKASVLPLWDRNQRVARPLSYLLWILKNWPPSLVTNKKREHWLTANALKGRDTWNQIYKSFISFNKNLWRFHNPRSGYS